MKSIFFFLVSLTIIWNNEISQEKSGLEGKWINENMEKAFFPECNIIYENNLFYVQLWHGCDTCDGYDETASNEISRETDEIKLISDQWYVKKIHTLKLIEGKLIVKTVNHYKDGRPKASHTDTFIRSRQNN